MSRSAATGSSCGRIDAPVLAHAVHLARHDRRRRRDRQVSRNRSRRGLPQARSHRRCSQAQPAHSARKNKQTSTSVSPRAVTGCEALREPLRPQVRPRRHRCTRHGRRWTVQCGADAASTHLETARRRARLLPALPRPRSLPDSVRVVPTRSRRVHAVVRFDTRIQTFCDLSRPATGFPRAGGAAETGWSAHLHLVGGREGTQAILWQVGARETGLWQEQRLGWGAVGRPDMARPFRLDTAHVGRRELDRLEPRRLRRLELRQRARTKVPRRLVAPLPAEQLYGLVAQLYARSRVDSFDGDVLARTNGTHPRQHVVALVRGCFSKARSQGDRATDFSVFNPQLLRPRCHCAPRQCRICLALYVRRESSARLTWHQIYVRSFRT